MINRVFIWLNLWSDHICRKFGEGIDDQSLLAASVLVSIIYFIMKILSLDIITIMSKSMLKKHHEARKCPSPKEVLCSVTGKSSSVSYLYECLIQ